MRCGLEGRVLSCAEAAEQEQIPPGAPIVILVDMLLSSGSSSCKNGCAGSVATEATRAVSDLLSAATPDAGAAQVVPNIITVAAAESLVEVAIS